MFDSNQLITTIDPDAIPDEAAKTVLLPGALDDEDLISPRQLAVLVRWARQTVEVGGLDLNATFGDAVASARARFCKGRQRSFNIIQGIVNESRNLTAADPLSAQQSDLLATLMGALSGQNPHWDTGIRAKMAATSAPIKERLLLQAVEVKNRGELQTLIAKMENLFGRPASATTGMTTDNGVEPDDDDEGGF